MNPNASLRPIIMALGVLAVLTWATPGLAVDPKRETPPGEAPPPPLGTTDIPKEGTEAPRPAAPSPGGPGGAAQRFEDVCPPCADPARQFTSTQLADCMREKCRKALEPTAVLLRVVPLSGFNPYSFQDLAQLSIQPPATMAAAAAPASALNLFAAGTYGGAGCGILGSTVVGKSGTTVTMAPGPNGVTTFTVAPPTSLTPPTQSATGGGCTVTFTRPIPTVCVLSYSCAAPACSGSASLGPCPP